MPEEQKAEETVDTAETKSTETSEPTESTESTETTETKPETIGEAVEKTQKTMEGTEETSESSAEKPAAETSDDDAGDVDDVSSFLDSPDEGEEPRKTGEQKRIDKLTAERYRLQAENDQLKASANKEETTKPAGDRIFSDSELDNAEKKAFDDNDFALLQTVRKEREKNFETRLTKKYQQEQGKAAEEQKRAQNEWVSTRDAYSYLAAPNAPQLYPGSNDELNLGDPNSNLFRLAKMLYMSSDTDMKNLVEKGHVSDGRTYRGVGGQERAAADALKIILRKRGTQKHDSKETKQLKNKLKKSERKRSLGSSGAEKTEDTTPKKRQTPSQVLDEYVAERNSYKAERIGMK